MSQTLAEARARVVARAQTTTEPLLTTEEVDAILATTVRATGWQASTPYVYGAYVLPVVRHGLHYRCIQAGTTGALEPAWPGALLRTPAGWGAAPPVGDGTVLWQVAGRDWSTLYDVDQAVYQAWLDKAAKVAPQYAQSVRTPDGATISSHAEAVHAHCLAMAAHYRPITLA